MVYLITLGVTFTLAITFLMYAICYVSGQANRFENDLDQELFIQKLEEQKHGKK